MTDRSTHAHELTSLLCENELEFLRCLVNGESQEVIASHLGLGEEEGLSVRKSLMRTLGANCTADAVREGIYVGF